MSYKYTLAVDHVGNALERLTENKPQPKNRKNVAQRQKIRDLIASDRYTTMSQIAKVLGISRERVRQLLTFEDITFNQHRTKQFTWPCPRCDKPVNMKLGLIKRITRPRSMYCGECKPRICYGLNGHVDPPRSKYKSRMCLLCERIRAKKVVRWRHCMDCRKLLPVSAGNANQEKVHGHILQRCASCHGRKVAPTNFKKTPKDHCSRGHSYAKFKKIHPSGNWNCTACVYMRDHNYAEWAATRSVTRKNTK